MRRIAAFLAVALLAPAAGVTQTLAPLPAAPGLPVEAPVPALPSPALDSLQGLDSVSLPREAGEGRGGGESLFDGERSLSAAPARSAIPPARDVPFKGETLPSFAFSQHVKIGELLVRSIDRTQTRLDIAIHGLSIPGVADAIVRAHRRGVAIRLLCNEEHLFPKHGHARSPELQKLVDAGLEIRSLRGTGKYGVMHDKFALFDGELMKFGSFNWSEAANDLNYENAKFDDMPERIAGYGQDFEWMWALGTPVADGASGAPKLPGPPPAVAGTGASYHGEAFPVSMYSPDGGIEAKLVRAIELTEPGETIDIAMFAFFSQPIAEALAAAHRRGVVIRIVSDESQGKRSPQIRYLIENGLAVRWSAGHDGGHGVMHNKFGIFNREMLETGSYNWSDNAELHNFENANFVGDPADIAGYAADFEEIWAQAAAASVDELQPEAFLPNPSLEEDPPGT